MRDCVISEIVKYARKDKRIMLLTGDLGYNVTEIFAEQYPDRYINCGIAEENMISVAAGLAMEGNKVFVYSLGNFPTLRCMEQLRNDVCYHQADVKIISVGGGFSYGSLGMSHHATEDIGAMRILPYMQVYTPADPVEAESVLNEAYEYQGPGYIRLARGRDPYLHKEQLYKSIGLLQPFETNETERFDAVIITAGTILEEGIKAVKLLRETNLKIGLFSCPRIKPMDIDGIREIALKTRVIITVEEHNVIGGLGGAIAEVLSSLPEHAVLLRTGLEDSYTEVVGSGDFLRRYYGIDSEHIAWRIQEYFQFMGKKEL